MEEFVWEISWLLWNRIYILQDNKNLNNLKNLNKKRILGELDQNQASYTHYTYTPFREVCNSW